jgi:hypothetical protein
VPVVYITIPSLHGGESMQRHWSDHELETYVVG